MNRRKLLHIVMALGFCLAIAPSTRAADIKKPNILFILADDLGYGDLGCYGQKIIQTPNINRLAAEARKVTQFYAGNPVCAPARGTLITGLQSAHAFVRDNRELKPERTIAIPTDSVTEAQ